MSTSAGSAAAHTGLVELRSYQLKPEGIKVSADVRVQIGGLLARSQPPPPPRRRRRQWSPLRPAAYLKRPFTPVKTEAGGTATCTKRTDD